MSFELRAGQCLAVFGPNGAGKTTLLRLLGGLLKASEGVVSLSGSPLGSSSNVRARIGLISHRTMLYPALTAVENVEFAARLYGRSDWSSRARRVLDRLAIAQRDVPVRLLSRGMQQRVSIARALVNEPVLLLADEPYSGLDESGAQALTSVLTELKSEGAAIVVVTHQLNEGLNLADFLAVMIAGSFARYQTSTGISQSEYASGYRDMVTTNA